MPFDPENPFAPADPSQWPPAHTPLRITVYAKPPPPSDGIDDGPDDWIAPGNPRVDTLPNDWFLPPPTPSTAQFPPGTQPNPNFGSAYPPVRPDPFAAYWSQIPAGRIGALAWAPPYLPPAGPSTNNFPTPTAPPAPPILRTPTLGVDSFPWLSTQSLLPSPTIPKGGMFDGLATLATAPPATSFIPSGGKEEAYGTCPRSSAADIWR